MIRTRSSQQASISGPNTTNRSSSDLPPNAAFVFDRVCETLDRVCGVSSDQVGGAAAINKCAYRIWAAALRHSERTDIALTRRSAFFGFEEKVSVLFARARKLGVDKVSVARSLSSNPSLFHADADFLTRRFWGHVDWLKRYQATPEQTADLSVRWPKFYSYKTDILCHQFTLCLALTETPLFCLKGIVGPPSFEQRRDYILCQRPGVMANGLASLQLRKGYAELFPRAAPTSAILRGERPHFEQMVVAHLGHDPDKTLIPVDKGIMNAVGERAVQARLQHYVEVLVRDMMQNPFTPTTRRQKLSLVETFLPEGDPTDKTGQKVLLTRMAMAGLFKGYRPVFE